MEASGVGGEVQPCTSQFVVARQAQESAQGVGAGDAKVVAAEHANPSTTPQRVLDVGDQRLQSGRLDEGGEDVCGGTHPQAGHDGAEEVMLLPGHERREAGERVLGAG